MPGMMDTVLNLGLNDETVEGIATRSGDRRFAFDSYRRFIHMYSDVVLGVEHQLFADALDEYKERHGLALDTELEAEHWSSVIDRYQAIVAEHAGRPFPQDVAEQLWGAVGAVFRILAVGPRQDLPASAQHSRRVGHRGQRSGHGVRQPRRYFGDRRSLYPQPVDRNEGALRRVPSQRPGRGRRRRHPYSPEHHRGRRGWRPAPPRPPWKRCCPRRLRS